jgi:hypothetical protein
MKCWLYGLYFDDVRDNVRQFSAPCVSSVCVCVCIYIYITVVLGLKSRVVTGSKPFIMIVGCHLNGPYGGILLLAVGLDENNWLFVVTYVVIESIYKNI